MERRFRVYSLVVSLINPQDPLNTDLNPLAPTGI